MPRTGQWGVIAVAAAVGGSSLVAVALAQPSLPSAPPAPTQGPDESELSEQERVRRQARVAKVGDVAITVGDVEDSINSQSPFLRTRYRDPVQLREFVQNMVRFELLAREAEERGYDDSDAVVRSRKQHAVQQLIRKRFDERITPQSIPEEDVREYYEEHEDEYHQPERIRAAHILLEDEEKAEKVLEEAREADLREFGKLARKHSVDTETNQRGGDLRFFTREGRPPRSEDPPVDETIVEAAFELEEVGDIVEEPVEVDERWSIIMLTGRREARSQPLEEVEGEIRRVLQRKKRKEAIEAFVDELRKRYEPKIYEERMKPIELDPSPNDMEPGFPERGGDQASKERTPSDEETGEPASSGGDGSE